MADPSATERSIIVSAPNVRAILDDRKTQMRWIVKLPHLNPLGAWEPTTVSGRDVKGNLHPEQAAIWHTRTGDALICPYGVPGDRLWVRETWFREPHPSEFGLTYQDIPHTWAFAVEKAGKYLYRADAGSELAIDGRRWRPSIHMPRAASRITLEVTGVRVERLQDISEDSAKIEGCAPAWLCADDDFAARASTAPTYRQGFARLWRNINGADSWDANPWVWVVEFRRIEPEAPAK